MEKDYGRLTKSFSQNDKGYKNKYIVVEYNKCVLNEKK